MTIQTSHSFQGHGSVFWLAVIGLPCVAFLVSWGLYEVVIGRTHYSLGILVSFFVAAGSAGLISGAFEKGPLDIEELDVSSEVGGKLRVMTFAVTLSTSVAAVLLKSVT